MLTPDELTLHEGKTTPSTPIHAAISSTSAGTGTPSTSTKNDSLNTQAKSVREQPWGVRASSR